MKFPWCEKDYYYQHQHQQLIVAIVLLLPLILKTTMSTKSSKCLLGTSVISRITASTTTRYGGGSHHDNLNQMITYSSPAAARRIRIPPSSVLNMNKQQSSSFAAKGVDKNIKNTSISLQVSKVKQQQQQQPESTTMTSLPPLKQHAHRIILMRHGESEFNNANIFTGWCDVALTPRGIVEAIEAGQVFASHDLEFVQCYSSLLTRSIATAYRTLEAAGIAYTPISYDWRLNERHYGALQGLSKERTADRLGRTLVMKWRRSYYARPPLMTADHPHYFMIECDGRYRHLKTQKKNQNHAIISPNNRVDNDNENEETNDSGITKGESLQDCQLRVIDVWENRIIKDIMQQEERQQQQQKQQEWNTNHNYNDNEPASPPYSLVVAHANTLRALVMHLDNIPPGKIESVNIPTAIPFFYDIDALTGNVIRHSRYASNEDDTGKMTTLQEGVFTGQYITDEMKKRNFLERRRAVQDPWLWALHDEQVAPGMLLRNQKDKNERQIGQQIGEVDLKNEEEQEEFFNDGEKESGSSVEEQDAETLKSIGEEAFRNTEMFARNLGRGRTRRSSFDEQ